MSIEQVVSVGALLSTIVSFAGVLLHRRGSSRPELEAAVEALKHDTQALHQLSVEAGVDRSLSPEELQRLQEAIERIQEDIRRARSEGTSEASTEKSAA